MTSYPLYALITGACFCCYQARSQFVITLMTSGFAIDKLLEVIHSQRVAQGKALTTKTHFTGFVMVLTGILLLIMEGIYYIGRHAELAKMQEASGGHTSRGIIVWALVFLVGAMLMYLIIDADF